MIHSVIVATISAVIFWDLGSLLIRLWIRYLLHKETKNPPLRNWEIKILSLLCTPPRKTRIDWVVPENEKFPLSEQEIRNILKTIAKKYPLAVIGIDQIIIRKRHLNISDSVRGAYTAEHPFLSGAIFLFSFPIDEEGYYLHGFSEKYGQEAKMIPINEELSKQSSILTFLHELGHHYLYNTTGILKGEEAEQFCDDFASKLATEFHLSVTMDEEKQLINDFYISYLKKKVKEKKERVKQLEEMKAKLEKELS